MKLGRWFFAVLSLFCLGWGGAVFAASDDACHGLMTEKECAAHQAALAGLAAGPARERYLAEHAELIRYRSGLCSREQYTQGKPTFYPTSQKVVHRY